MTERQQCDQCGAQVHTMSLDVMVSVTCYDDDGEITKTMEPVSRIAPSWREPNDEYMVYCSICAPAAISALAQALRGSWS